MPPQYPMPPQRSNPHPSDPPQRSASPQRFCPPEIGQLVAGRYHVTERFQHGGMSDVLRARDLERGERVVLKLDREGEAKSAIERERAMLACCAHPHVVRTLGVGRHGDRPLLVLEDLGGRDLFTALNDEGPVRLARDAHRTLRQLAIALDEVHARGVVHRDVKLANVVESADGKPRWIDFGIAVEAGHTPARRITVAGTPPYMAPERARGLPAEPASDRYAFAALALELLTGERPYAEVALGALWRAILERRPRRPSELGLPVDGLDAIFDRALAASPAHRFATCVDFVDALAPKLEGARPAPRCALRGPYPAPRLRRVGRRWSLGRAVNAPSLGASAWTPRGAARGETAEGSRWHGGCDGPATLSEPSSPSSPSSCS